MIFIAHRGNVNGSNVDRENHPDYIIESISQGYDAEIDVHLEEGQIYLGHDEPRYEVSSYFLEELSSRLWCHAKTASALRALVDMDMNCFFHVSDAVVLTSKRYLWTYPGANLVKGSIAVLPEIHDDSVKNCAGICSDFIQKYREVEYEYCRNNEKVL